LLLIWIRGIYNFPKKYYTQKLIKYIDEPLIRENRGDQEIGGRRITPIFNEIIHVLGDV